MTAAEALADPGVVTAAEAILRGHVQGLGVRPAIANLAARCRLRGSVSNIASGVAITIEGAFEDIVKFRNDLQGALPAEAVLEECLWSEGVSRGLTSFAILQLPSRSELTTPIPRDRAVCRECLRDTFDSHSRRRDYPFTSCTKCGPRFSIIESMPYERATTPMRSFRLCSLCTAEYQDADDRRFHAQTNACAHCGPRLWSRDREGRTIDDSTDALSCAAAEIRRGGIIAIRGVGGYQLFCDATNDHAVRRLRAAKRRPEKPFAVMLDGVFAAGLQARSSLTEWAALSGAENPIVIRSTPSEMGLCSGIAPGLSCIGLLLPTTPLHALLAGQCNVPLVVTSGNVDGDPLAVAPEEAERSLADIADLFLHHDRPIAHPVDDSVVRVIADRPVTIRLARGLAPLPLPIATPLRGLALGGQQKVAIALSNGSQAVLGPHLGDLDSLAMRRRFEGHVEEMLDLYDCRPRFVAIDHHPDYFTSRWVQQLGVPGVDVDESGLRREVVGDRLSDADSRGEPHRCFSDLQHIVRVQHHHAHIAAGMLECGWQNREVFGVAFDGTGSGTDGTIWGGEFLLCTLKSFRRVGRLRPFALPGGERAIREPWRVAISLLTHVLAPAELEEVCRRLFDESLVQHTALIQRSMRSAPVTTSAGRLFDGIAALVLQVHESSFEGQPALQLEDCCDPAESGRYDFSIESGPLHELDWRPAIGSIVDDLKAGVTGGRIAMKFHRGLASGVAKICARFQAYPVVLGGGVFQNRTLVEELSDRLPSSRLGLPGRIPPNDGGLAAGQLAIAAEILSTLSHH